jgi:hypothetical protein
VREWCTNSAAIDPFAASAIANSEDGVVYRWDFAGNSFIQQVRVTAGVGEAYTPAAIGADGAAYAIDGANLLRWGQAFYLAITAGRTGSFIGGQSGAVYTLTVTNSGSGAANGSVAVMVTPPASLRRGTVCANFFSRGSRQVRFAVMAMLALGDSYVSGVTVLLPPN